MSRPLGWRDPTIVPRIMTLIDLHLVEHGYAPTVRELAQAYGCTVSTMHTHLQTCREQGLVEWERGKPRTLRAAA